LIDLIRDLLLAIFTTQVKCGGEANITSLEFYDDNSPGKHGRQQTISNTNEIKQL